MSVYVHVCVCVCVRACVLAYMCVSVSPSFFLNRSLNAILIIAR